MKKALKVIYPVCLSLCIICAAVVAVVCFKPLYYRDIDSYQMTQRTGLPEEEIRANYDEMIRFLMRFSGDELTLPTLPMSEGGKIHFADVKHLFNAVKILGIISLAGAAACAVLLRREDRRRSLYAAGFITLGIPAVLGIFVAVAWERFFVLFHKVFFHNDYWIFDARTDPVITILPDGFFMHCMIAIVGLVALGALGCFTAGKLTGKRMRNRKQAKEHSDGGPV